MSRFKQIAQKLQMQKENKQAVEAEQTEPLAEVGVEEDNGLEALSEPEIIVDDEPVVEHDEVIIED